MSNHSRDKDAYLTQYPGTKKWINVCIICHAVGYKPEMPQDISPGLIAQTIRKMFSPLSVNEISVCSDCAQYLDNK